MTNNLFKKATQLPLSSMSENYKNGKTPGKSDKHHSQFMQMKKRIERIQEKRNKKKEEFKKEGFKQFNHQP